jgi:hypothetical protein
VKATITIDMDGDVFSGINGTEVARILRVFSRGVDITRLKVGDTLKVHDLNGNPAGRLEITEEGGAS